MAKTTITKIDDDTYQEVTESDPVVYKISDIQKEISELIQCLNQEAPKNPELIEFGKMFHPYYQDKLVIEARIAVLNALKDKLTKGN